MQRLLTLLAVVAALHFSNGSLDYAQHMQQLQKPLLPGVDESKDAELTKVHNVLNKLRAHLSSRQPAYTAFTTLMHDLRESDVEGSGRLDPSGFRSILKSHQLNLNDEELDTLKNYFTIPEDGRVHLDQLLSAFAPSPSHSNRLEQITTLFAKFNKGGDVPLTELRAQFKGHVEDMADIATNMGSRASKASGSVSLADFQHYYMAVSLMMKSDSEFSSLLQWHFPSPSAVGNRSQPVRPSLTKLKPYTRHLQPFGPGASKEASGNPFGPAISTPADGLSAQRQLDMVHAGIYPT